MGEEVGEVGVGGAGEGEFFRGEHFGGGGEAVLEEFGLVEMAAMAMRCHQCAARGEEKFFEGDGFVGAGLGEVGHCEFGADGNVHFEGAGEVVVFL